MFCNKWLKKNLIIGSIVLSSNNLINGCSNIGKVDNLANALYDHCMKNKDLKIGPTTFTKENAKNFAELFGKMVKLTEYLEAKGKGNFRKYEEKKEQETKDKPNIEKCHSIRLADAKIPNNGSNQKSQEELKCEKNKMNILVKGTKMITKQV